MTRTHSEDGKKQSVYVQSEYNRDDEINLLELWDIIWGGRWFIIGFTLLCTVLAAVVSFLFMPPVYKASATLETTKESKQVIYNYLNSNKFHRNLISKYDLLKHLYPHAWSDEKQTWTVNTEEEIQTIEKALYEDEFPLKVVSKDGLINIIWQGQDPAFCVTMIENTIKELRIYLNDEYISDAQTQMQIYQQELGTLAERFEDVWNQFWKYDKLTVASIEVLNQYTRMKDRISTLTVVDVLARKFVVLDDPIFPQKPYKPDKKIIIGSVFVTALFISIFLHLFYRFVQYERQRKKTGR